MMESQWFVDEVEKHNLAQRLNWIESRGSVFAILEIDKTRAHMISVVWFTVLHEKTRNPGGKSK